MTIEDSFKPYLTVKKSYKGGKSKSSVMSDKKVFKLSSNENPLGTSPKVIAAIVSAAQDLHIYPDRTDKALCQALAKDFDHALSPAQFMASNSGSDVIEMILRAFVNIGDEVIVSNPCFVPYEAFSSKLGGVVVDVPLKGTTYVIDVEGIINAITNKTKVIFLTSPNNPTGSYISKADLESLLPQIPAHIVIIYDEVYRHFAEAADFVTGVPYVAAGHNIIAVNSFSKTYGLAGMRVGYCYGSEKLISYIKQLSKPFIINKLSLVAAIAALSDQAFIDEVVSLVKDERRYIFKELDRLGINYTLSQANFYLIEPPLPAPDFVAHMMSEGVMVRAVDKFGAPGKVRISIGDREANLAVINAISSLEL